MENYPGYETVYLTSVRAEKYEGTEEYFDFQHLKL